MSVRTIAALVCLFAPRPAFAQEPPPPPPEEKKDVVIEYVPAEGTPQSLPPPPTAPPKPAAPPPPIDEGKKERFVFHGQGGFQYEQIVGVPVLGGRVRAGIGSQTDSSAHYATLSIFAGETENGLRVWDVRAGWVGDIFRSGIIRIGIGAEVGYLVVHRATLDDRMFALGAGVDFHAGFDVYQWGPRDDHALTLQARFDASVHFGGAALWGPSIMAGLRY